MDYETLASAVGPPTRIQDFLFEFIPILRLDSSVKVDYEVAGYAEGNKTVDWLIRSERVSLLLDVKNRTSDLIESLGRFQLGERDPDGTVSAPTHDPSLLFRSVEPKLRERSPSEFIQAVWVVTALEQEELELQRVVVERDLGRGRIFRKNYGEGAFLRIGESNVDREG